MMVVKSKNQPKKCESSSGIAYEITKISKFNNNKNRSII